MFSRRDEARTGAAYARRVCTAVAAQESRPGAQVVQRLDMAGQTFQTIHLPRGTFTKNKPYIP